jgi:formylmethanofuran dehydrogenase subunit C
MSGNAIVNGNANPGIGDSVTTSGNARVTGSTTPVKSALSYPAPTAPGNAPTATGNAITAPGNATSLGNFSISGNTNQTLTAGVYSCTGLSVTGNATLTISGAVTIYVNGSVSLSGNSVVTQNLPSNFSIQMTSSGSVTLSGNGELDADIYAPLADVAISGNGNFCGVIVAKTMAISGNGLLHYDLAGGGGTSVITLAQ